MNGKTATLLHRYGTEVNSDWKTVRKLWNSTPRNKRWALRQTMTEMVNQTKVEDEPEIVKTADGKTLMLAD